MKKIMYLPVLMMFFIVACSGSGDNSEQNNGLSEFETGVVIKTVKCAKDSTISYALYLPSNYSGDKKFPVMFSFDPHAVGSQPVELYKDLAENFGVILVGSNSTENGMGPEDIKKAGDAIYTDVISRFSIESSRIYALGFSGGAKVASLFASAFKINTVIGCGGGIADVNAKINYDFIGIAGTRDFNFLELISLNQNLSAKKISNEFIMFEGKHEWPGAEVMKQVFILLDNKEMVKSTQKDEAKIKSNYSYIKSVSDSVNINSEPLESYIFMQRFIQSFSGLIDPLELKSRIAEISTENLQDIQMKLNTCLVEEIKLQQDYVKAFQTENADWWKSELERVKKLEGQTSDRFKSQMYSRLISYMSIVAYSYSNNALKNKDLVNAQKFLLIYKAVDPENPDVYFFYAKLFAMKNENEKAAMFYSQAVELWKAKKMKIQKDPLIDQALEKSE